MSELMTSADGEHVEALYRRYKGALMQCRKSYAEGTRKLIAEINERKAESSAWRFRARMFAGIAVAGWACAVVLAAIQAS